MVIVVVLFGKIFVYCVSFMMWKVFLIVGVRV